MMPHVLDEHGVSQDNLFNSTMIQFITCLSSSLPLVLDMTLHPPCKTPRAFILSSGKTLTAGLMDRNVFRQFLFLLVTPSAGLVHIGIEEGHNGDDDVHGT